MPKSVLRAVLGRTQFALHATRQTPHGASRLVQAMPAWLLKTRRAPSRHSRDARVYGHSTTAMHKLSTPPLNAGAKVATHSKTTDRWPLCVVTADTLLQLNTSPRRDMGQFLDPFSGKRTETTSSHAAAKVQ